MVCDGHGGADISKVLGQNFKEMLVKLLVDSPSNLRPEEMVDAMRTAYERAAKEVDSGSYSNNSQGSTLSVQLLQLSTMVCATLQLGDCEIIVADAATGEVVKAEVLYYIDDGEVGGEQHTNEFCQSRLHWFGDPDELKRFNDQMNPLGCSVRKVPRRDVMKGEERYWGEVRGANVEFNECARAVESMDMYPRDFQEKGLHMLQRRPEFVVWQLPRYTPLVLIVCCDGLASKSSMPDGAHTARCLVDPEAYMGSAACLDGTLVERFAVGRKGLPKSAPEWNEKAVDILYEVLHGMCPDRQWRRAVELSGDHIKELRDKFGGKVPPLLENPQAAVSMTTNIPVLMMSDDNVTLTALVIDYPASQ